jgi:hypothetical protein
MFRIVLAAALALVCAAPIAEARPLQQLATGCNQLWPCEVPTSQRNNFLYGVRSIEVEMTKERRVYRPVRARRAAGIAEVSERAAADVAFGSAISRPARYIAGRLICAINVNSALAERGIRGTGSAVAKAFLGWGRASAPVPGAVAVSSRGKRGGHVAIVSRVEDGQVYVWNPSSRGRGWQEVAYRHRAISFRVPG